MKHIKDSYKDQYYIYCTECCTNVLVTDEQPDCPDCSEHDFRMPCNQELDFSDNLYDRWE